MPLFTEDFNYDLPEELIAAYPATQRPDARLLVVDRKTGTLAHTFFREIASFLQPDDLLILNDSRVRPAALATRDGGLTLLLLEETSPRHWKALVKPGKRAQPGHRLFFQSRTGARVIEAEVLKTLESGERVLRFFQDFALEDFGEVPLPPYILQRRAQLIAQGQPNPVTPVDDRERYQTVYAQAPGSVAAPTAGLHFTPELLARFRHAFVTLHVGLGTFRPIKTERVENHVMHLERYVIPPGLKEEVARGGRIVAVGTTAARVLEAAKSLKPQQGSTDIFIYPPYRFQRVQALVTNFHLPKSTLFMLVCAFAGRDLMLRAYREAVTQRYHFFSYGDAMLIL